MSDYPRPQCVRSEWQSLNGSWEYSFQNTSLDKVRWKGAIQVPFPPESELSGLGDQSYHAVIWYQKTFSIPKEWGKMRILLHFGAVDYSAKVWVNTTLKMEPDIDKKTLKLSVNAQETLEKITVKAIALQDGQIVAEKIGNLGESLNLVIPNAKLWSPDEPFLYDLNVTLLQDEEVIDEVSIYFGMRNIEAKKDETGVMRLFLNNQVLFQFGLLDQGFWPDGLYTAPTDEALRYDIEVTKKLGFNMIRKHVKVEPARWYYWAEKLGVLVWQDIPSGDAYAQNGEGEIKRNEASAKQFELELKEMIDEHFNHQSTA